MHLPLTVLLFNRPEESRRVLESLARQTCPVPPGMMTLSVDGFRGSRDESLGLPDRTSEVAEVARECFPRATVVTHEHNLGIARHFDEVESASFGNSDSQWALFFEDDYVLASNYLESLIHTIDSVRHDPRVAVVSATGDALGPKTRGQDSLYPMDHAWAFALRRSHHEERRPHIRAYLDLIHGSPYYLRDYDTVTTGMADIGILTLGTSQDYVKQAIRVALDRVAVTTGHVYGEYIGINGEHFTPEIFSELRYDEQPLPSERIIALEQCTREFIDSLIAEQRSLVARATIELANERVRSVEAQLLSRENAHAEKVDALWRRIRMTEAELHGAKHRLGAIADSTSWRITKPLRAMRQFLP